MYDARQRAMSDVPMTTQRYISEACEEDLLKYGDSFRGAGYTKSAAEAEQRYALMLAVVREVDEPVTLLDFGCGLGHLLDHLQRAPRYRHVQYTGLDLSPKYLQGPRRLVMQTHLSPAGRPRVGHEPAGFRLHHHERRVQLPRARPGALDVPILAAVVLRRVQALPARHGVQRMSRLVDWQRDDLFHLSFDAMAQHVGQALSRHFVVRHDYGAYRYTTYVYRSPSAE